MNQTEDKINEAWDEINSLADGDPAKIVRIVRNYPDLLNAIKFALDNLRPKGNIRKDYSGHLAIAMLTKVIHQVEGNG